MSEWQVYGSATIDDRPASPCTLTVRPDGHWSAVVSTFTLAGEVELLLVGDCGGHFCGPATVVRSRADSHPLTAVTELEGSGPLLVVAPEMVGPDVLDAEVLDELESGRC